MMEGERKLATIRRIAKIEPIEGADRIVKATIDGWELVTQKENYKVGDLCVYFEIDSFLPVRPEFEFLRKACFKSTKNLGDGFRIKTIKLRGQISQGLSLPLKDFFENDNLGYFLTAKVMLADPCGTEDIARVRLEEGMDLTEYFGVKKWEAPISNAGGANMGGSKGNFPSFIPKTDQERIQNCFRNIQNYVLFSGSEVTEISENTAVGDGETVFESGGHWFKRTMIKNDPDTAALNAMYEVTLKMDGSSMTVYHNEGSHGVCSRNLELTRNEENVFWKTALKGKIVQALVTIGGNYAIQGELMGPGVQGNREQLTDHEFFIFDVYDIDRKKYLNPIERENVISNLYTSGMDLFCIRRVPFIANVDVRGFEDVAAFLVYAERPSLTHEYAEGVVFKSYKEGGPSFKAISNRYLLNEKD